MPSELRAALRWRSVIYDRDSALETVVETHYEDARRVPLGEWSCVEHTDEMTGAPAGWTVAWDALRSPFEKLGYTLFRRPLCDITLPKLPEDNPGPLQGALNCLDSVPRVFPALDRKKSEYLALKVLRPDEYEFLKRLNTEPSRSSPRNSTVDISEFISLGNWTFAVMPFYELCDEVSLRTVHECLQFQEQVLEALEYLHNSCGIAHLDISHENIYRDLPTKGGSNGSVRYILADFDVAVYVPPGTPRRCDIKRIPMRRSVAPEVTRNAQAIDPFAADVYQVAVFFYDWFSLITPDVPGLFELLQEMSSFDPSQRPPVEKALEHFRTIRDAISPEVHKITVPELVRPRGFTDFVPRPYLRAISELYSGGGLGMVSWFVSQHLRKRAFWCYHLYVHGPIARRCNNLYYEWFRS